MPYVYVLRSGSGNVFKIGRTRGDVDARIKKLSTGNPQPLTRFDVIETDHESLCENFLHNRLRTRRQGGEFFALDPGELELVIAEARRFIAEFVPKQTEAARLATEENDERILDPDAAHIDTYQQLLQVREALDDLELQREQLETALKLAIGTAAGLDGLASWKTHSTQRFDTDTFKVAEPVLYSQYVHDSRVRTFRLLTSRSDDPE